VVRGAILRGVCSQVRARGTAMTRLPYEILAPDYNPNSAGVRALYQLQWDLQKRGHTCFISDRYSGKGHRSIEDRIQICPDLFDTDHPKTVRWLLHYAGFMGGPKTLPKEHLKFYWSKTFVYQGETPKNLLSPDILDRTLFCVPPDYFERKGDLVIARKFREHGGIPIIGNARELVGIEHKQRDVAWFFKNRKRLITYDNTFMIEEAYACGCEVVMMHNEFFREYHSPRLSDYENQLTRFIEKTQEYFK
jgi:hypothetical protein